MDLNQEEDSPSIGQKMNQQRNIRPANTEIKKEKVIDALINLTKLNLGDSTFGGELIT